MSFSQKPEATQSAAAMEAGAGSGMSQQRGAIPPFPPMPSRAPAGRTTRVIQTTRQRPISDVEFRNRIQWQQILSPRFALNYDPVAFPSTHAVSILEELEQAYSLIFGYTHEAFTDRWKVYVADSQSSALHGHMLSSHIDIPNRSLCLLHGPTQHLYSDLVLLLTHAMRIRRYERHYEHTTGWASLEDAFALFLNERIALQPEVFPFFGADPDLIAHNIYYHHSNASIARTWQSAPNRRSFFDSVLFGAFFLYLGDTFSDDRIMDFSKLDGDVGSDQFAEFFGASLDELEHAWIAHLPVCRLSVTSEEQESMLQHWERTVESRAA